MPTSATPKLYNPRHPERTLLYQTVAEHYETWLDLARSGQFDGQGARRTPKPYVRKAFTKYLECGIFAHGFGKQHSEPRSEYVRGAKSNELHLIPLELIDRIAALIPPPRTGTATSGCWHRIRRFGMW